MTRKNPHHFSTEAVNESASGKPASSKRPYESSLREAQTERTRQAIVEEAYGALRSVPAHELSYSSLADSLGISSRTIYRHFPDRSDLVRAVARRHVEVVTGPSGSLPVDLQGAASLMRRMHEMLEADPGAYRLFFQLPVRSQGGVQRFIEVVWSDVLANLPDEDRAAAAGLFELFMGPYAYDVLHENWGLSAANTSRVCLAALDILAAALERDPAALSTQRATPARFEDPVGDTE